MSDEEIYKLSQAILISYFFIWIITVAIIYKYAIYAPMLAFIMTIMYLIIQGFNQNYRQKTKALYKCQDIANIVDVYFICISMLINLSGLLMVISLKIIFGVLAILCISYIYAIYILTKKSNELSQKTKKK